MLSIKNGILYDDSNTWEDFTLYDKNLDTFYILTKNDNILEIIDYNDSAEETDNTLVDEDTGDKYELYLFNKILKVDFISSENCDVCDILDKINFLENKIDEILNMEKNEIVELNNGWKIIS